MFRKLLHELGALRVALAAGAAVLTLLAPFGGGAPRYDGLGLFITVLAPTLFVILLFVLPLDMVMTRIFMTDKEGEDRARYRRILRVEGGLFAVLVLAWSPLLYKLLRQTW